MTATVESDLSSFQELSQQLLTRRDPNKVPEAKLNAEDIQIRDPEQNTESKRFTFKKGESSWDIDEDAEIEFVADKAPVKMKLRDLKDRAAGDVAIKNRMHSLAEEKKKVQSTLKEFSSIAKKDPMKALEYISNRAKEADSEFEYERYLTALADQAEKLSQMGEHERRAYQAEKKLEEVEGDLSQKERELLVKAKAQEASEHLGITESQFNQAAQMVLENPVLMESIEDEQEFFDTVQEMVVKANNQKTVESIISRIDPAEAHNQTLVFEIADWMEDNPDFTEADIHEIVSSILSPKIKQKAEMRLSDKQRSSLPLEHLRTQGASEYQLLVEQLKERRQKA